MPHPRLLHAHSNAAFRAAAIAFLALPAAAGRAEALARDDFSSAGANQAAGWASPWDFKDQLQLDPAEGKVVGTGYGTRTTLQAIDFAQDGRYFFRITLDRQSKPSAGNSYAALQLFNKDATVNNRPLVLGIDSGSKVYFGLGPTTAVDPPTRFGQDYTLVGRLQTSAQRPDTLAVWAFEGTDLPDQLDAPPVGRSELDYGESVSIVRLQTGNGPGFSAAFSDLRITRTYEDLTGRPEPMPESQDFKHEFRTFKHLRVADDAVRPLAIQWAIVSLLPNGKGQPPSVLVQSEHPWLADNSVIYHPAGPDRVDAATPLPNARLPLYDVPQPDDRLPRAQYQAVPRPDGDGHDLYNVNSLLHVGTIDAAGQLRLADRPDSLLHPEDHQGQTPGEVKKGLQGTVKQMADADGDGVQDLLITTWIDRGNDYWPRGEAVWSLTPLPQVGPHADVENTDGFRGYDLAGNWLGSKRTQELSWMKGRRVNGRLRFTAQRPVYLGRDDFSVQWRSWGRKMGVTALDAEVDGQTRRCVVLFNGDAQVKALPVLETPDSPDLHLGRAVDLLDPETPTQDLFLTVVRDVVDLTGDGQPEIVVGTGANGRAVVLGGSRVGEFQVLGTLENLGGPLAADTLTVPARGDWDGDGKADLVTGDGTGYYLLWPGTDDPLTYDGPRTFRHPDGRPLIYKGTQNLQGPHEAGWSYSQPGLFDWDADGQLDLLGNDNTNTLRLHTRAARQDPWVMDSQTFTYRGQKLPVAWRSRITALPGQHRLAGDDRPVLLLIDLQSRLQLGVPESLGSTTITQLLPLQFTDG